jgi:hypothetical protein
LLKECSGFISSIDGEKKSKMIEIVGDYYYNQSDFKIWQREEKTDSYKKIVDNEVDSLLWNMNYVLGYCKYSYFIIDINRNNIKYLNKRDSLYSFFKTPGELNNTFPNIPAIVTMPNK